MNIIAWFMKVKEAFWTVALLVVLLVSGVGTALVTSPGAAAASVPTRQMVVIPRPLGLHIDNARLTAFPQNLQNWRMYHNGQRVNVTFREEIFLRDHNQAGWIRVTFQGPYGARVQQQLYVRPHQRYVVAYQSRLVIVQHGRFLNAWMTITGPQYMSWSVTIRM